MRVHLLGAELHDLDPREVGQLHSVVRVENDDADGKVADEAFAVSLEQVELHAIGFDLLLAESEGIGELEETEAIQVRHALGSPAVAVLEDGHAVRDLQRFFHVVRDVDDALPLRCGSRR